MALKWTDEIQKFWIKTVTVLDVFNLSALFWSPRVTHILKLGYGTQGLRSGVDRASQKKIEIASTSIKVATLGEYEASDPDPE